MTNDQTVTQADREAAAQVYDARPSDWSGASDQVRRGLHDDTAIVQAFARHRTAHSGEGREGVSAPTQRMEKTLGAKFVVSGEGRSNGAEVRDEIHDALVRAYSQGANDVHAEWQKHWESGDGYGPPDPDFTESSHDHAASEMPGLGAAIAALSAPQGEVERMREALEPFARLARPINGEEGRPTYLQAMAGPNGTDELKLSTYVGDGDRIDVMDASDFRRAAEVLDNYSEGES